MPMPEALSVLMALVNVSFVKTLSSARSYVCSFVWSRCAQ